LILFRGKMRTKDLLSLICLLIPLQRDHPESQRL
jgi:hypothetical protein